MLGIELTEKQKKIWNDMGDNLAANSDIRHLALQYYLEYRENLNKNKLFNHEPQKISNLFQIAYFISEKNQVTFNMRGQRVSGVALSINEIIKKNSNFEDFIFHMKEMLKVITIEDKHIQQEIENCLKKFKFTMTFHHKFVSTFKKIIPSPSQFQLYQSLLWLIFILIKQSLPIQNQNDIIEITCLIASTFIYYVQQCTRISGSEFQLEDSNFGGALRKQSIVHVFLEYFRLKDISKYQQISIFFKDQINHLKQKTGLDTFFNDRNIEQIYKRIDCIYMKKLNDANIDERHFLKQRINTVLNANRFTPFGGRRCPNKSKINSKPNQILSHRVLNYDKDQQERTKLEDIENEETNQTINKNASILLKKLVKNKTPAQKTPLIKATPMTNAMQMYNWVLEKSNYHKFDANEFSKYIKGEDKTLKLINGLWKDVCLNESDKGYELTQKQKMVILILSAQIVYFVTNSNQSIDKLLIDFSVSWYQVWIKIDCFLTYDNRMPISIKLHLLSVDTSLISKQLWKQEQAYLHIFKDAKLRAEKDDYDRLYRRVLHEIVYQIFFLSKKISIQQQSMNSIFLLCQFTLVQHANLLIHRNLYHIILCSAYAVTKAQGYEMLFYNILMAFKELNNMEKEEYQEFSQEIYMQGKEDTDLITFYNQEFVKKTKPFILQIKYQSNQKITSNRKNLISSPVKELLPKNLVALTDKTNKLNIQTPFTVALQAYHQSPLLREKKMKNLASCIDGKRILEKRNQFTKQESLKQTSALINQKWRNVKSPDQKLNTTIKKGSQNA